MGDKYQCHVCGGEYDEGDVMSTTCVECKNRVCVYCTELDTSDNTDVCDKCADEKMFNKIDLIK